MSNEYADVFTCIECRNPRVAEKSVVKKEYALISGKCLKGHPFDLKLPMEQEHKWIGYLKNSIYKCRCGMPLEDFKVKEGAKEVELTLKCTKHTQTRKIDTVLWLTISTDKETQKTIQQELEPDSGLTNIEFDEFNRENSGKKGEPVTPQKWSK